MSGECDFCGECGFECKCDKSEKHAIITERRREIIRKKLAEMFILPLALEGERNKNEE